MERGRPDDSGLPGEARPGATTSAGAMSAGAGPAPWGDTSANDGDIGPTLAEARWVTDEAHIVWAQKVLRREVPRQRRLRFWYRLTGRVGVLVFATGAAVRFGLVPGLEAWRARAGLVGAAAGFLAWFSYSTLRKGTAAWLAYMRQPDLLDKPRRLVFGEQALWFEGPINRRRIDWGDFADLRVTEEALLLRGPKMAGTLIVPRSALAPADAVPAIIARFRRETPSPPA